MARGSPLEEAERLLARRDRVPIEELFRAIHAVNPTDKGLRGSVEQRHYAAKSALQSLLIERHSDALRVRPDPRDPSIVSLVRALTDRDAAHARVDQLSDAARAWVERQLLDSDDEVEPAPTVIEPSRGEASLLEEARSARDRYELDQAETLFREAFARDADLPTATALLDFLLEAVFSFQGALDLSMPEALARTGMVRVRLAEAALGVDDPEAILRHAQGLHGVRVGHVLREAVKLFVARGDERAAARALTLAREADPSSGDLPALEERIARVRSQRRQTHAQAVADAADREAWDEAREHLSRWMKAEGDTVEVRQWRARIESARSVREAARLVDEADHAPDPEREIELLRQARDLGRWDLDGRIRALERAFEGRRREAEVGSVLELLAGGCTPIGLAAFAGLDTSQRAGVRQSVGHPDLEELDRLLGRWPAERALDALEELAVLRRVGERGDPGATLRLVEALGLDGDPVVERLRAEAKRAVNQAEQRNTRARVARAEAARAVGDATLAAKLLDRVVLDDAADQARAEVVRAWLQEHQEAASVDAYWQNLAREVLPFDARDLALERSGQDPLWAARAEWADEVLRRQFELVEADREGLEQLPHYLCNRREGSSVWAASSEGPVVVVETFEFLLLVREFDPRTGHLARAWWVRPLTPVGRALEYGFDQGLLWIASVSHGKVLLVDLAGLRVVSWCDLDPMLRGRKAYHMVVSQGIAWVMSSAPRQGPDPSNDPTLSIDLRRRVRVPTGAPPFGPTALPGPRPRVAGYRPLPGGGPGSLLQVLERNGTRIVGEWRLPDREFSSPIPHPDGGVLAPAAVGRSGPNAPYTLELWRCPLGADPRPISFGRSVIGQFCAMATCLASGHTFLHVSNGESSWLAAYVVEDARAVELWRQDPSPAGFMITTEDGSAVWFVCRTPAGRSATFHLLGPTLPTLPPAPAWNRSIAPAFAVTSCPIPLPKGPAEPVATSKDAVSAIRSLAASIDTSTYDQQLEGLDRVRRRFPGDPYVAYHAAHLALIRRDWVEIRGHLEGLALDQLTVQVRRHAHHLLGAARMYGGDFDGAAQAWTEGSRLDGNCPLQHEVQTLRGLVVDPVPPTPEAFVGRRVLSACREADRRTQAGDARGAFAALDHPDLWGCGELQTEYRRAAAALDWAEGPPTPRRRAMALATPHLGPSQGYELPELPVDHHRDRDAMREVRERLVAELDPERTGPIVAPPAPSRPAAPDVPRPPDEVGMLRSEVATRAASGDLEGAREGLRRMESAGARPDELAQARRAVDGAVRRAREPIVATLRAATRTQDVARMRAAATALLDLTADDVHAVGALKRASRFERDAGTEMGPDPGPSLDPITEEAPPKAGGGEVQGFLDVAAEPLPEVEEPPTTARAHPAPVEPPSPTVQNDAVSDALDDLRSLLPRPAPDLPEPHEGHARYHLLPPDDRRRGPLVVRGELVRKARHGDRELPPLRWPASVEGLGAIRPVLDHDLALHSRLAALDEHLEVTGGSDVPRIVADAVAAIVGLLARAEDVRFEDHPIRVVEAPLVPRLVGTARPDGALELRWSPALRSVWTVGDGYALTAEGELHPLSDRVPARVKRRLLRPLPVVGREEIGRFVEELVLDGGLEVDLPPDLLAPVEPTGRARCLRLWEDGDALCIGWAVRYAIGAEAVDVPGGRPGVLARVPGGGVFRRDPGFEAETAVAYRHGVGVVGWSARFRGQDAYEWLEWARTASAEDGWVLSGEDKLLRFRMGGSLVPRVSFGEATDWFDLAVEFVLEDAVVTVEEALRHFEEGRRFVPLPDGRVARLPERWLQKYGPAAAELAKLRQARDTLGRWAAHVAAALLPLAPEEEGRPWLELVERLAQPPEPMRANLTGALRPYQEVGFAWLVRLCDERLGGVLADDMGLGKSIQTLALLARLHAEPGPPSLVVAPRSVLHNWVAEAERWAPQLRVRAHSGGARGFDFSEDDVVVTTYGTVLQDQALLAHLDWRVLVLDEAHLLKNPASQTRRAVARLRAMHRVALTGTPLENDLVELYSLLDLLLPGFFGTQAEFQRRYATPIQRDGDADALERLRARVAPFLLRRRKAEVAPELPAVQWTTLRSTLGEDERAIYLKVRDAVRVAVHERIDTVGFAQARIEILGQLNRLRTAACDAGLLPHEDARRVEVAAKVELLLETLEVSIAEGHRCLVFSQWPRLLHRIEPHLQDRGWGYLLLEGATTDRKSLVERFQKADGPPIFLVSLKAGGVGLNLVAADQVFLLDPWWNPQTEAQAVDRAHRIGQERPVTVYRLVSADTIEERILALQERKAALFDAVVDGGQVGGGQLEEADVVGLVDAD